jgi:hypothetical protein
MVVADMAHAPNPEILGRPAGGDPGAIGKDPLLVGLIPTITAVHGKTNPKTANGADYASIIRYAP